MSTPKTRAVQVPGAQPAPVNTEADASLEETGLDETGAEGQETADPEKEALRAELEEMRARLKAAEAAASKPAKDKTVAVAPAAASIGGAKKTESGWIVPETFGAPVKKA